MLIGIVLVSCFALVERSSAVAICEFPFNIGKLAGCAPCNFHPIYEYYYS